MTHAELAEPAEKTRISFRISTKFWPDANSRVDEGEVESRVAGNHRRRDRGAPPPGPRAPGVYVQACLAYELRKRGHEVQQQLDVPVIYDDLRVDCGYRIDLLVDGLVVVELKSVEAVTPFFKKKLLAYLKLSDHRLGLLINFNVPVLVHGVHRVVNSFPE